LALDSNRLAEFDFVLRVERFYAGLIEAADADQGSSTGQEPSLGGKLLYAGELNEPIRAMVVAGNITGAASLAATAGPAAQKQAVRDGVADFLVNSLDEALRILKNEIRKREPVAVCVGAAPEAVVREMLDRGVLPDLIAPGVCRGSESASFLGLGAKRVLPSSIDESRVLVCWRAASAPAQWMPKLDAIAMDCLEPDAWASRRWLRVAPRYLGRLASGVRLLYADREFATTFIERVRERVECGQIRVPVEIQSSDHGGGEEHHFSPSKASAGTD